MNYAIKGTEVNISDEIRSYVEKRLSGLDKFASEASRCDVELGYEALFDGPKYRVELMYHKPGAPLMRAEARGAALHEAIDLAAGELLEGLTSAKQKRRDILRRTGARVKEYLRGWRGKI
ncbi:MAG: ribosome-associated translation inhibitor RaiA [Patescibacteria group bacterium]